ncbi:hypothetical protein ACWF94_20635 [Streptomyces sp. NPDC055078]
MSENTPTGGDQGDGTRAPRPRWVTLLGVAALALVAAFLIAHLAGGTGGH